MSKCKLPWKQLASIYRTDYLHIAEDHCKQCEYVSSLCSFIEDKELWLEYLKFKKENNDET